jgi:hypothetical protein
MNCAGTAGNERLYVFLNARFLINSSDRYTWVED